MSFYVFIMRLPIPHSKQGNRFVLPPMPETSQEPNKNGANLIKKTSLSPPLPHLSHSYLQVRTALLGNWRPVAEEAYTDGMKGWEL